MKKIEIEIERPPSVNRLWRASKGGTVYRSPAYVVWRKQAAWEIIAQAKKNKIKGPFKLEMTVQRPDQRKRDLDNLLKAVLDALQDAGTIDSDSDCQWIVARWEGEGNKCHLCLTKLKPGKDDDGQAE